MESNVVFGADAAVPLPVREPVLLVEVEDVK
jgi:hypothetical protein